MATTATRIRSMDSMYDTHPPLSASLEDFEHGERPSPVLRLPSHHSGFRSDSSEAGADSVSSGPWSPPGWRGTTSSSAWYRHQPYLHESAVANSSTSPRKSREASIRHGSTGVHDEDDPTLQAANIPLPRGSLSPTKDMSPGPEENFRKREQSSPEFSRPRKETLAPPENTNNYIRFAVRAEVQQRTEPLEAVISWLRYHFNRLTSTRRSIMTTITIALLSFYFFRIVTGPPIDFPAPDLVKLAGVARSFEPLMYFSENGIHHTTELQETGVAVWDLGESVRVSNITSGPVIIAELDQLSESLQALSLELTTFTAAVDGDMDNILTVMEWARLELNALDSLPPSTFSSALANIHGLFSRIGILADPKSGIPNTAGQVLASIFGRTPAERTRSTLQRLFTEFLSTLEQSVERELGHTTKLFALFANIDEHFLTLQRSTVRELDAQERLEGEVLSSLWMRAMGSRAAFLRKYEKNKQLLQSLRERTVTNKNLLMDHSGKLMALKQNLEVLRKRLVQPLIRSGESGLGVEQQVKGLESTYGYLKGVRNVQKGKVMEFLYGGRKYGVEGRSGRPEIEATR